MSGRNSSIARIHQSVVQQSHLVTGLLKSTHMLAAGLAILTEIQQTDNFFFSTFDQIFEEAEARY